MKVIQILFIVIFISSIASLPFSNFSLTNWQFRVEGRYDNRYFKGNVPSNIYLDLMDNRLIDDPYIRDNFQRNKWIHNSVIYYRTRFNLTSQLFAMKIKQIVFQGLDTYATITLNNQAIGSTNNSYVKYTFLLKNLKLNEQNILEIKFSPSSSVDAQNQKQFLLPFSYGWTRKPPYQYSWDWAPELISVGIWKNAYILCYQQARIDYVWFRNKYISAKEAIINIAVVLKKIQNNNIPFNIVIKLEGKEIEKIIINQSIGYKDISIKSPRLWWPRNIGTPFLYNFTIELKYNQQLIQTKKYIHGIRTVSLNTTDGAFQFIINGYPIYAKGANYVPPDMFYPRFTNPYFKTQFTLQKLMDTIVQSNYNMIRVWGGGQYESDQFYQQCSRRGIMIFQDFMFSVNVYPANQTFLRNCEQQVRQQIRRIRNYPALALWSGNNQILQGINDWGWGSPQYKRNYDLLFQKLIRKILQIESPDISYIPSSPIYGSGSNIQSGDIHSWRVWAAAAPFQTYETQVARFNSQFGTQAFPVWETIKFFTQKDDRSYNSEILLKHERHGSQFNVLKKYIAEHMNPSKNFQMEVYQSGIVQAYALNLAIGAQRTSKPHTWGTLYWQFNDAWPGISWSSVDYFGRWKPLQYYVKKLYTDIAVFFIQEKNLDITVKVVNDKLYDLEALLRIQIYTFEGDMLMNSSNKIKLTPNQVFNATTLVRSEMKNLIAKSKEESVVFYSQIIGGRDNIMQNTFFLKKYRQLELIPATVKVNYNLQSNYITLKSNKFLKNVYISHKSNYIKLSDNYFDMIPNKPVKIKVQNKKLKDIKSGLLYRSLLDTYQKVNTPSITLVIQ